MTTGTPTERLAGVINELHGLARAYGTGAVRPPSELTAATLRSLAAEVRDVIEALSGRAPRGSWKSSGSYNNDPRDV